MSVKGTITNDNATIKAPRLSMRLLWSACLYSIGFDIAEILQSLFIVYFVVSYLPIQTQRDIRQLRREHRNDVSPQPADNEAEEHAGDGRGVELVYAIS